MMDSSNPAAHEKFLTAPMLAALVSGGLLLAWPYLAIAEFGPGGSPERLPVAFFRMEPGDGL